MTEDPMDGLMMTDRDRHELRDIAREMADAARRATLPLFRAPELSAENKRAEGFDPVTEADRAAERAMRVDIFFVLSGFLITGILARELAMGRFSLLTFYERRARRILPALFALILVWAIIVEADHH